MLKKLGVRAAPVVGPETMVGVNPARDEEHARLSGARADFVSNLARRLEALRASLRALEQAPGDGARRNGLLRRLHALASAAKVLGFASVAEALGEAEKRLRRSSSIATELIEVARALDLLPSLVLGAPVTINPAEPAEAAQSWPLSVLIFGTTLLSDALASDADLRVEVERTEDPMRARELARVLGPDIAVVDADRRGAREFVDLLANDPLIEPVPVIVVGDLASHEAAAAFIGLGAARVLPKPVSPDTLRRTVIELYGKPSEARTVREPFGDLSSETLATRVADELRRGLVEAIDPNSANTHVNFGEGTDVLAAVWGAVARLRELITVRSHGAVRFYGGGPEGAIPLAPFRDDRRPGERGVRTARDADNVALQGRRVLIADDDPAVVWFMSGLAKAFGAEVVEAHDGARALDLAFETWPDIVVSDVLMPELDGFSLCHELKRDVAVRDVPVILLSWKEDLLQRVRELGADADGYLRKEAAASTVAERLREVLRPRARVEQRLASGGEVRGRLDGLTPRLILELLCAGQRDARVSFRDAVYLYEVQVREGHVRSASRSASDGSFDRGERVLAGLLGVSAGRFVVQPDNALCRSDFEGSLPELLKGPITRARAALRAISAHELFQVTAVEIDDAAIAGYLGCTPEPARGLIERLMKGVSPRELIASGGASPRLLEAVLSDLARRGAILSVERADGRPYSLSLELPARRPTPALGMPLVAPNLALPTSAERTPSESARIAVEQLRIADTEEESSWFTFELDASSKPPTVAPPKTEPAEPEVTPEPAKTELKFPAPKAEISPPPAPDAPVRVSAARARDSATATPTAGIKMVRRPPRPSTPEPSPVIEVGEATEVSDAELWAEALGGSSSELPPIASTEVPRLPSIEAKLVPGHPDSDPAPEPEPESKREAEARLEPEPDSDPEPDSEREPRFRAQSEAEAKREPLDELDEPGDEASSLFSEPSESSPFMDERFAGSEGVASASAETVRLSPSSPPVVGRALTSGRAVESDPNESTEIRIGRSAKPEVVRVSRKSTALGASSSIPSPQNESGGVMRTIAIAALAAGVSFAIVRWGITAWLGAPSSTSTSQLEVPSAALSPRVPAKAAPVSKFENEIAPLPPDSTIHPERGLLQIETPGAELLYVDGEFVGRGPSRSVPLKPGKHELRVLRDTEEFTHSVQIEQSKKLIARFVVATAPTTSGALR